jgi:hypothetical protein
MGPLGDGNPVVLQDDFDAVGGTSGISSFTWKDSSGDYGLCLYDGTNYIDNVFGVSQLEGTTHFTFEGNSDNNKVSSFKIVLGDLSNCP